MLRRLYCIYDLKAESVVNGLIQAMGTDAEAERMFRTIVAASDTLVHQHPDDFGLCFLGEVDYNNLLVVPAKSPHIPILLGRDVVREIERARNMDVPSGGIPEIVK